jgi:hypothetical protein
MLNKEHSPRSNIVILTFIAIACIALMLSLLSYQFFILASNKIVDIASQEVRSNARIEVHANCWFSFTNTCRISCFSD